ncbi:MAG TPA: PD-(D/E)XK nuclease family protein, partial [Sphingomicrobium sp.]|nr:PD-(D/E)XK nuclease family protein [Sphingomicrobium sp.]
DERCPPFDEIIMDEKERDLKEHMRLLYVALTRAADQLIVSGVLPRQKKDGSDPRPANSWHVIVERALGAFGLPGAGHVALRYGSASVPQSRRGKDKVELSRIAIPDWAGRPAPAEARPPRPLAPSALGTDDESAPAPSEAMRMAALRGTQIHQLLERLPAVAPSERSDVADQWLKRSQGLTDPDVRREIADKVCDILSEPAFAPLFGPDSLGEAPLAATLSDGRVIAGTVDRLFVGEDCISVIDFKTGRVPAAAGDVPNAHRAQMAAYSEALEIIFPGRKIRAFLLYTTGPRLIELMP